VTVEIHPKGTSPQFFKKLSFGKGMFLAGEPPWPWQRGDTPPSAGVTL